MFRVFINKKVISAVLALLFLLSNSALAIHDDDEEKLFNPIVIKDGSSLSITDCVAAAYKNSPVIRRYKYNLDIAKSNVGVAKSQYFPVINAGIGFYNENNSDNVYYDRHLRDLPSVGVSVNQLIYNFGKTTSFIKMNEFYKIGAEYEFMDSLCSTLFNVKDKYYKLLKTKALVEAEQNNLIINENILKFSKKQQDIEAAKVNLKKAQLNLIEAQNSYNNAKIDLTNAMYLNDNPDYTLQNTSTFTIKNDFNYDSSALKINDFTPLTYDFAIEDAVEIAYKNSPDLQVLIATKNAMEESLKYVKKTYLPDLTGTVGYGFNKNLDTSNNSLYVGVGLNSSVNIKELHHSIQGADAQLKLADNEVALFKKDLFYEVRRAFNNVDKCVRQIPVAKANTEEAFFRYKLVEKNYKAGIEDYGALHRAKDDFINAQKAYITSISDYNIALIQVEMAMHVHIVDIHHKSEHAMHYHSSELLEHLNKALGCDEDEHTHSKQHKNKKHKQKETL